MPRTRARGRAPAAARRASTPVRGYIEATGSPKKGACHLFRHAMATLMLENGADVRFIQAMLGHASLESTQIYTQVSITKLRQVHAATHPGARLAPPRGSQGAATAATPADEPRHSLGADTAEGDGE